MGPLLHPAPRADGWRPPPGYYWESWAINGEVCLGGLDPPVPGGRRLTSCLTWMLRSYASQCRRIYDGTGAVALAGSGQGIPSSLGITLALHFDLALSDRKLIRARLRQRRGREFSSRWPTLWLEGSAYEYLIGTEPLPPVGTARRKLLLLAEHGEAQVSPQVGTGLPARAERVWRQGLDTLASADALALGSHLVEDERAFAANLLLLFHTWPTRGARHRPSLVDSLERHQELIAGLAPDQVRNRLPVIWHALWRLPAGMKWSDGAKDPWMRYPAVTIVVGARSAS